MLLKFIAFAAFTTVLVYVLWLISNDRDGNGCASSLIFIKEKFDNYQNLHYFCACLGRSYIGRKNRI